MLSFVFLALTKNGRALRLNATAAGSMLRADV
jgi:hypothetical protein